ncbi:hypothetical protein N7488_008937 [Penicillium malachiteum]|nr:hypothetical protein N7488_008937 [Penicillium malachiteum]
MILPLKKEIDDYYVFPKMEVIYEGVIYLIRVCNMIMAYTTSRTINPDEEFLKAITWISYWIDQRYVLLTGGAVSDEPVREVLRNKFAMPSERVDLFKDNTNTLYYLIIRMSSSLHQLEKSKMLFGRRSCVGVDVPLTGKIF